MTVEQLRKVSQTRPFPAFTLLLADGTRVPVPHPEFIWMPSTASRTFFVAEADGTAKIINLLLVEAIEFADHSPKRRRRQSRGN